MVYLRSDRPEGESIPVVMWNMSEPTATIEADISKAILGDRVALGAVLAHFHDPLISHLRHSLGVGSGVDLTPEDVVQEAFVEVCRRIRTVEYRGQEAFFAWIKTIARTRMLNMIEARKAQKRGGGHQRLNPAADATATCVLNALAGEDPTPSRVIQRGEALAAAKIALQELDPDKREVVELRYVHAMPIEEIARRLGKTESAVKMTLSRALDEMRETIDRCGEHTLGL